MSQPDLISVAEAAEILGRSVRTVHRLVDSGSLPVAGRLPGRTGAIILDRSEVEDLADDLADEATS